MTQYFDTTNNFVDGYRLIDGTQLNKNLANPTWSIASGAVAKAGGTATNSTKIVETITQVTGASAPNSGLVLPQASTPGRIYMVINESPNQIIIYADNSTINGFPGNVGISLGVNNVCYFAAVAVNQWFKFDFLPVGFPDLYMENILDIPTLRLWSSPAASSPAIVALVHNYAPADDGGGLFWLDATDHITPDNGTTVVVDAVGNRWKREQVQAQYIALQDTGNYYNSTNVEGALAEAGQLVSTMTAVKTIADLRALPSVTTDFNVDVFGYYADGDGGGGIFYGVTAGGPYNDNGGTIITPGGVAGSATAWIRIVNSSINVKWFGAKGDGVADDAAAINAAVSANSQKTIFFPSGFYKIGSTVNFTNVNVEGSGQTSTVFVHTGIGPAVQVGNPLPYPTDNFNHFYSNFGVQGNVNTTFSVWMLRCVYCNFTNINVVAPAALGATFVAFRVSGAMYLNTYTNCIFDTIEQTPAANGIGWWVGNGYNEVLNFNAACNVNTFITCRAVRIATGFLLDISGGNILINPDAEDCITADYDIRCLYSQLIGPWMEIGIMVFNQYVQGDGSGGFLPPADPENVQINGTTLPLENIFINYGANITISNARINNLIIGAPVAGTRLTNCDIRGVLTNNGQGGYLEYRQSNGYYLVTQQGAATTYGVDALPGGTKVNLFGNKFINAPAFGSLELNTDISVSITGPSPMIEMTEMADPGSAPANGAYLFLRDNGAGKTQLCVKFGTGVTQVLATEL